MNRITLALMQLKIGRAYVMKLLESISDEQWFIMPTGCETHIAWQAGHLAIAHYNLLLDRIRGFKPDDLKIFPKENYIALFGRTSQPSAEREKYPSPPEIRSVLTHVHELALAELEHKTDAELDQMTDKPHPIVTTKFSSLLWCAQHEMIHAGQIGLLRRVLGHSPIW